MNLFSKIGSLFKEKPSDSIMDDNVAIAAEDNNPYVSAAVLGARNAYDTLHMLMGPLIKGKKSSLKQIDKWLNDWLDRLKQIEEMYAELLGKINDLGADFTGAFTLDFAKEAWEIVQDTPILRRYMGEANYWALYDAMGILATQTGSLAGDLLSGVKATIKQTILALISMTDGLLCLESYLGMIQQYWGALYFKITPLPLLDSIVPNVTCAYWYKLPIPSKSNGTVHQIDLNNNPPGRGFTPLPLPVPDPKMVVRQASYIGKFDYQNPDTWYLDGTPYYLPNTMYMLERALQYWGSSYTNEYLPAINAFYPRRSYGEGSAKPLRVGHTFAQLDTDKMSLNGTNVEVSDGDSDKPNESATSVNEELADIIGYSIDHGRETKFPCFGVYGDLLSMQSWHYKEMPYLEFVAKYAKVKSGSSLYYEIANPGHILFYHSSYVSQTRSMQMAIVHEALESTTKSYGSNDSYTFYVFPCESISVSKLSGSPSLGSFLSVDAVSPSGDEYHYITMRNPIPKCAKYVDPEKWSLMDIIHELYLLAYNLAGLCGDNGERLKNLQDDLSEFHISTPQFIGQLPENNGQYSPFRFEIFKDYADKIEKFVNSVYDFRAKIIAATEAL